MLVINTQFIHKYLEDTVYVYGVFRHKHTWCAKAVDQTRRVRILTLENLERNYVSLKEKYSQ